MNRTKIAISIVVGSLLSIAGLASASASSSDFVALFTSFGSDIGVVILAGLGIGLGIIGSLIGFNYAFKWIKNKIVGRRG